MGETIRREALAQLKRKIHSRRRLARVVRRLQRAGRRVVFTNGCFDVLHAGHVALLSQARRYGDTLIVGINSDRSVRALKGKGRPVVGQADRALVLAGLECVDFVTVFDEPTPMALVVLLRPDVLIKGANWGDGQIVGRDLVERSGGRVVRIPLVPGRSTSRLLARIRATA